MNRCFFIGRLTRDPEVHYTNGENSMATARFSLAVDRRRKQTDDGQPTADFINMVAFGKNGEFAEKYLHKGMKMAIEAHVQTGSYTNKDGKTVYTTDFIVDSTEFCEKKGTGLDEGASSPSSSAQAPKRTAQRKSSVPDDMKQFTQVQPDDNEELPWA